MTKSQLFRGLGFNPSSGMFWSSSPPTRWGGPCPGLHAQEEAAKSGQTDQGRGQEPSLWDVLLC